MDRAGHRQQAAVLAHQAGLVQAQHAAVAHGIEQCALLQGRVVVRGQQGTDRDAGQFLRRIAEAGRAGRIQEGAVALRIESDDALARGFEQAFEAFGAFPEGALAGGQLLARQVFGGGVAHDLGVATQLAVLAQRDHHAVGEEAAAVAPQVPALVLGAAAGAGPRRFLVRLARGAVFRQENHVGRLPERFLRAPAGDGFGAGFPFGDAALGVGTNEGVVVQVVEDQAQAAGVAAHGFRQGLQALQRGRLAVQGQRLLDARPQQVGIDRLLQDVDRAEREGALPGEVVQVAGRDEQDGHALRARMAAHQLGGLEAVQGRHLHVHQHGCKLVRQQRAQGRLAGIHGHELGVHAGQQGFEHREVGRLIVHEKDAGLDGSAHRWLGGQVGDRVDNPARRHAWDCVSNCKESNVCLMLPNVNCARLLSSPLHTRVLLRGTISPCSRPWSCNGFLVSEQ